MDTTIADLGLLRKWYRTARNNAKWRSIPWQLTFDEFALLLQPALDFRVVCPKQVCLMRFWDRGAYAVGNVIIGTAQDNVRESRLVRRLIAKGQITP